MVLRSFLCFLVFLIIGCTKSPNYRNFPPMGDGPWVAYGDSLTSGYGVASEEAYPFLLGSVLGLDIVNEGRSGRTTGEGLEELESYLERPRVVFLCLGGNDVLRRVPPEEMVSNLGAIIDEFHLRGSFVVLFGVRGVGFSDPNGRFFSRLAREKQVFYIPDVLEGVLGDPRLMLDGVHPNGEGYSLIAGRIAELLSPILEGLR